MPSKSLFLTNFKLLTSFLLLSFLVSACGGGNNNGGDTNTAPVTTNSSFSLLPGNTTTRVLSASDAEGDSLTYSVVTNPTNGTLTLNNAATGDYTYTLDSNASSDNFTFWANDGSLDSNISTVTITAEVPTAPATGLQATPGDQRVTLNWDEVPGADSYNVYWSTVTGSGKAGTLISNVTPPFYHIKLTNGLNYYYVITAVNAVGESVASTELSATPVDIPLSSLSYVDTSLATCIATATVGKIYVHDLTRLDCPNNTISDLTGIENLTSLTGLYLYNNSITDISALASMSNLLSINLGYNNITDLKAISYLSNLVYLYLYFTNITDASLNDLSEMTQLQRVDFTGNNLTSLDALAKLNKMTHVYLSSNQISDASVFSNMPDLIYLYLQSNNLGGQGVGNVDALTNLTSAVNIWLAGNQNISCVELTTLINALGSPPVDTDGNGTTADVAIDGVNCATP